MDPALTSDWSSWPAEPRALLDRSCARYGGRPRWLRRRISLTPRVLTGLLPAWKGMGASFGLPGRIRVEPSAERVVFEDYPGPGAEGIYEAGTVVLLGADQREQAREAALRPSFRGLHKLARWRPLDALYFFGYAIAHYHAVPFTLGEARFVRQSRWRDLDAVTVVFPPTLHTHSPRQTFYFDADGLIRRHDYVADIVGPWTPGAHFWRDYTEIDGTVIARTRHVVARLGRLPTPVTALHAEFTEVSAESL